MNLEHALGNIDSDWRKFHFESPGSGGNIHMIFGP
jgi:hypothetical protein